VAQAVELLPCKHKALRSNPSSQTKQNKTQPPQKNLRARKVLSFKDIYKKSYNWLGKRGMGRRHRTELEWRPSDSNLLSLQRRH
jgi:hypothetical protein